jgi:galactose mutarotase-like enzyme
MPAAYREAMSDLIALEDERAGSRVLIAPRRGALVSSFRIGERELLYLDAESFRDPTKNVRGGIPVLFPAPGKLADDRWQWGGRSGSMKQHGFARTLPWQVSELASDAARLTLTLEADETTRAQYPWEFRAELRFELQGTRLRLRFALHNLDRESLPFALGYHPYFLVHDKARARIDTQATRVFDNVSKQIRPFAGFDLTARELDLHLLDHGSQQAALHWGDATSVTIAASPEFRVWVVWTLTDREFICVEPWSAGGNALNTGEGLTALAPGEVHEAWIELEAHIAAHPHPRMPAPTEVS